MCEKCIVKNLVYLTKTRLFSTPDKDMFFVKNMKKENVAMVEHRIKKLPFKKYRHIVVSTMRMESKNIFYVSPNKTNITCDIEDNWQLLVAEKLNKQILNLN